MGVSVINILEKTVRDKFSYVFWSSPLNISCYHGWICTHMQPLHVQSKLLLGSPYHCNYQSYKELLADTNLGREALHAITTHLKMLLKNILYSNIKKYGRLRCNGNETCLNK